MQRTVRTDSTAAVLTFLDGDFHVDSFDNEGEPGISLTGRRLSKEGVLEVAALAERMICPGIYGAAEEMLK